MDNFDNINHVNITPEQRAQTLIEALPYIQRYYGKTIVIKYGGNAMISEELRKAVIDDIVMLSLIGVRVIVVHGGGPEISAMLKKTGKESRFVNGLRYTDEETMDIVWTSFSRSSAARSTRTSSSSSTTPAVKRSVSRGWMTT